ncbi:MAG: site-specific integrase [Solirubrobacterales bacterium]|nr:site-specific integrase [Solirubrobacterales bacterium]
MLNDPTDPNWRNPRNKHPKRTRTVETGIYLRHSSRCEGGFDGPCHCHPTYQAQVHSAKDRKPVRKTFRTLPEARRWRHRAKEALRKGELSAPSSIFLRDAAAQWVKDAEAGVVRTRSGEPYKPSAVRGYDASIRTHLIPEFGHLRLSAITRKRVQELVDKLSRTDMAPATVANAIIPLRVIYRRAIDREEIYVNPTERLKLPRDRRTRERIAEPREVEALLGALDDRHRLIWTLAIYTGLRKGELQALRWENIDLEAGILKVEHSLDPKAGLVSPKSESGRRRVPIPQVLAPELVAHMARQSGDTEFVLANSKGNPFNGSNVYRVSHREWARAGLKPLGFHEARHTYASFMIAAGANLKALSAYMGHSSILVTIDRYGHLMPGNEKEAANLLDAFVLKHASVGAA